MDDNPSPPLSHLPEATGLSAARSAPVCGFDADVSGLICGIQQWGTRRSQWHRHAAPTRRPLVSDYSVALWEPAVTWPGCGRWSWGGGFVPTKPNVLWSSQNPPPRTPRPLSRTHMLKRSAANAFVPRRTHACTHVHSPAVTQVHTYVYGHPQARRRVKHNSSLTESNPWKASDPPLRQIKLLVDHMAAELFQLLCNVFGSLEMPEVHFNTYHLLFYNLSILILYLFNLILMFFEQTIIFIYYYFNHCYLSFRYIFLFSIFAFACDK